MNEVFPGVPQIQIAEYYYRSQGGDVGFDPEFGEAQFDDRARVHALNAALALSYADAYQIVAPTPFQASLLPRPFQDRCQIIHEGVDTELARPQGNAEIKLSPGTTLSRGMPIVTFVNRVFEPMRGFHIFMRALPRVLDALPSAHVVIVGADGKNGYGAPAPNGATWRQAMLTELGNTIDTTRVHFTGPIRYEQLLKVFSVSTAHVYLTYPFVLSWSLLDAMACECLVIGSDTAPVRDLLKSNVNGILVDFFDHIGLANVIIGACSNPDRFTQLRRAARQLIVNDYDRRSKCEPAWLSLIDDVLGAKV